MAKRANSDQIVEEKKRFPFVKRRKNAAKTPKLTEDSDISYWLYPTGPLIVRHPNVLLLPSQVKLLVHYRWTEESKNALSSFVQTQMETETSKEDQSFVQLCLGSAFEITRNENSAGNYHVDFWERNGKFLPVGSILFKGFGRNRKSRQWNISEGLLRYKIGKTFDCSVMSSLTVHPNVALNFVKCSGQACQVPSTESVVCVHRVVSDRVRAMYVSHLGLVDFQMEQEILLAPNYKITLTAVDTRSLFFITIDETRRRT